MPAPDDRHGLPGAAGSGTGVVTTDREIVITRTFAAPRAVVFAAWTTPEQVTHWWDPTGAPLARCEIDLRPGGAFRWVHASDGGAGHQFSGIYREIAAPERIVFTTRMPGLRTEVVGTLVFVEADGRTTLTLRMTCASAADRDALLSLRVETGTMRTLDNLADYLASRRAAGDASLITDRP